MSELDPNLAALLARTRPQIGPPPDAAARMLSDFHARLQPGGPDGDASGPPDSGGAPPGSHALSAGASQGASLLHALKIAGAIAALSTVGVAGLWVVGQAMRPAAPASPPVVAAASTTAASTTAAAPPTRTDASTDASLEPVPAPSSAPAQTAATASDEPSADAAALAPRSPLPATAPAKASPTNARSLAAELQLIRAARSAPPAQALELLARHAEQFPAGELSAEREALRTICLCTLGREREAARARADFERLEPGPLLREKVQKACSASATN